MIISKPLKLSVVPIEAKSSGYASKCKRQNSDTSAFVR